MMHVAGGREHSHHFELVERGFGGGREESMEGVAASREGDRQGKDPDSSPHSLICFFVQLSIRELFGTANQGGRRRCGRGEKKRELSHFEREIDLGTDPMMHISSSNRVKLRRSTVREKKNMEALKGEDEASRLAVE